MTAQRFADLPKHMAHLPVDHRGFPVPWFVAFVGGEPFFPAMEADKLALAHKRNLCWVCGGRLGKWRASVIGPMCAVNRVVSEPQSHVDCAQFSARNCPFLTKPNMKRVPEDKWTTEARIAPAGEHIDRNPGVCCVWIEREPSRPIRVQGGVLFELGEPEEVQWYAHGRAATRTEVSEALQAGLPALVGAVEKEMPTRREAARADLESALTEVMRMIEDLPEEPPP